MSEVEFNDPRAWGFCRMCAFLVARSLKGKKLLLTHERNTALGNKIECSGSGREPWEQPGPSATAIKVVSLTKSYSHLAERKRRHAAWVKAKAEVMRGMGDL